MFQLELIRDRLTSGNTLRINKRRAVRAILIYEDKLVMVKTSLGDYKFPGGGVGKYEEDRYALIREIGEETGFIDVTVGPIIGTAFEQNLDNYDEGAMFQMESVYYLCKLNSLEKIDRQLEQYEQDMNFTEVFVTVKEAYAVNQNLMDSLVNQKLKSIDMKANDWLERETVVLRNIDDSIVDKALWDIYECGQIMLNADRSKVHVDGKEGHANFVTNYDKMIQEELKNRLLKLYPGAAFVGEEGDDKASIDIGCALIVDPIDGTTNFMKDYGMSCISVGILHDGEQVAGIIYQPYRNEMYCAECGKGSYLNGIRIQVSDCELENSLVVFGTAPYYEELKEKSFTLAKDLLDKCIDVRRSGSAALDLCAVATGRADMYFEYLVCPWDIAAGSIIVKEAGGTVSTIDGSPISLHDKCSILATNGVAKLPYES